MEITEQEIAIVRKALTESASIYYVIEQCKTFVSPARLLNWAISRRRKTTNGVQNMAIGAGIVAKLAVKTIGYKVRRDGTIQERRTGPPTFDHTVINAM